MPLCAFATAHQVSRQESKGIRKGCEEHATMCECCGHPSRCLIWVQIPNISSHDLAPAYSIKEKEAIPPESPVFMNYVFGFSQITFGRNRNRRNEILRFVPPTFYLSTYHYRPGPLVLYLSEHWRRPLPARIVRRCFD